MRKTREPLCTLYFGTLYFSECCSARSHKKNNNRRCARASVVEDRKQVPAATLLIIAPSLSSTRVCVLGTCWELACTQRRTASTHPYHCTQSTPQRKATTTTTITTAARCLRRYSYRQPGRQAVWRTACCCTHTTQLSSRLARREERREIRQHTRGELLVFASGVVCTSLQTAYTEQPRAVCCLQYAEDPSAAVVALFHVWRIKFAHHAQWQCTSLRKRQRLGNLHPSCCSMKQHTTRDPHLSLSS